MTQKYVPSDDEQWSIRKKRVWKRSDFLTCSAPALDRVFIELGPLTIYWYGIIIISGLLLGLYLATKESDRLGLKKDLIIDLIVFAAPIAILFARIYYVIFEWDRYVGGPWWKVFAVWEGGI